MKHSKKSRYSLNDLAEMAGVSKATVSRALNGTPGVSSELREKICLLAEDVGYHTNTLAQSFAKGHLNIVALIIEDIRNPFYAELAFNIQLALSKENYMLMIFNSEADAEREVNYLKSVEQFHFAGLFLLTAHLAATEPHIHRLNAAGIPVILLSRTFPSYTGSCVLLDNFQAGYLATMHLLELGHRRIGFIHGPHTSSASHQRYRGYCQAISNFNIAEIKEYTGESDLTMQSGEVLAQEFLKNTSPRPTAMVLANDLVSIGFMNGLKSAGIRIPEDLSIVSFDNIPFAGTVGTDLTSIDQHIAQISREAVRLMLNQLQHQNAEPEQVIIAPTLVVRKTTQLYKA